MRNQTTKKDPHNRGLLELLERIRSIWLGMKDLNQLVDHNKCIYK